MTLDDLFKDPLINIGKDIILATFFFWLGIRITNKKEKKAKEELLKENKVKDALLENSFKKIEDLQTTLLMQNEELNERYTKDVKDHTLRANEIIKQLKIALITIRSNDISEENDLLSLGLSFFEEKRKDDLLILLETRKGPDLNSPIYYFLKAHSHYLNNEMNQSIMLLQKALPFPLGDYFVYNTLGNFCYEMKNYHEALRYYKLALIEKENDYLSCIRIGECNEILKLFDENLSFTKNLVNDVFPTSSYLWNLYANSLFNAKRIPEAKEAYNRAVILGKHDENIFTCIGNIFKLENNFTEAVSFFKKSLLINSSYHQAYLSLGRIYWAKGEYYVQESILKEGIQKANQKTALKMQLAVCFRNQNRLEEAYTLIESCNMDDPEIDPMDLSRTLCDVAHIYRHFQQYERVTELLKKSIALDPDYYGSYYELGAFFYDCRQDATKNDDAISLFKIALSKKPLQDMKFNCLFMLGKIYVYDKPEPGTAIIYLKEALGIKEDIKASELLNIAVKNQQMA